MQEQQYVNQMDNGQNPGQGNGLVHFLLGLLTGLAAAIPVTALAVKKWCDKDKAQAVEEAENRGIQAGIAVALEESTNMAGSASRAYSEPNRGISEGISSATEDNPSVPVYIEGKQVGQYTSNGMEFNTVNATDSGDISANGESAAASQGKDGYDHEAYLASLQSPPDDDGIDDDIEKYNLTIDDEEATQEAAEFSDSRVQYLDMIERYRDKGGGIPPMTISREQFENEHYYEKCYINYYPDDDTFAEDDHVIEDPNYTFGFTSGREMFAPERTAVRDDPDICYIRNLACSTDFEITRMSGSYKDMVIDGGIYYSEN